QAGEKDRDCSACLHRVHQPKMIKCGAFCSEAIRQIYSERFSFKFFRLRTLALYGIGKAAFAGVRLRVVIQSPMIFRAVIFDWRWPILAGNKRRDEGS